jgi:ubiquinone/menaquinone biosynthesis C-methylase UbiE
MRTLLDLITGLSLANDHGRSRWLADLAGVSDADVVLDIGCGPGTALVEATRRGATAIGLDPSPTMLWLAARRATGSTLLLPGKVAAIPLPCGTATVAWATGSFHHWPDVDAALAEIHRVLAPNGRLFIVEREAKSHGLGAMHAVTPHRAEQLVEQLNRAGFVNVSVESARVGRADLLLVRALATRVVAEVEGAHDAVVVGGP